VGADVSVLLAASHLDTSADPHPHLSRPTTSLSGGRWWYPTSLDRTLTGRRTGADGMIVRYRPLSEELSELIVRYRKLSEELSELSELSDYSSELLEPW